MSFNIKEGGTWKPIVTGWVKVAGAWQQVSSAWVKVSGAWQQVYSSLEATVDIAFQLSSGSSANPCGNPGTTNVSTATAVGGTPPYTYSWRALTPIPDSGPYIATSPNSASTAFKDADDQVCASDVINSQDFVCDVTDANLQTATTPPVTVQLLWTDDS